MTVYRRLSDSDEWHWQPDCPHYPTEQPLVAFFVEAGRRPWYGVLCPECLRLEKAEHGHLEDDRESKAR